MKADLQFWALKIDFTIHSIIKPTNTQWSRKYYEAGIFSIQLPVLQYSSEMQYVYCPARPELGMITQRNYIIASNGFEYVQISGYFLENELNDKVINDLFVGNGNVEDEITRMLNAYKKDIPKLDISESQHRGTPTEYQAEGVYLGRKAFEILALHEMSLRVKYDYKNDRKIAEIWEGKDRTQTQTENNYIVFSTSFGNLKQPSILQNDTEYKNYAIVKGQINNAPVYAYADLSEGGYKKELFVDAMGETYDSAKMTKAQFMANLAQKGLEELATHQIINNVEFETQEIDYEYIKDFDLGDKCDIMISTMNLQLEARIVAVYEVIKSGNHSITLEFGNQVIKQQKARYAR